MKYLILSLIALSGCATYSSPVKTSDYCTVVDKANDLVVCVVNGLVFYKMGDYHTVDRVPQPAPTPAPAPVAPAPTQIKKAKK